MHIVLLDIDNCTVSIRFNKNTNTYTCHYNQKLIDTLKKLNDVKIYFFTNWSPFTLIESLKHGITVTNLRFMVKKYLESQGIMIEGIIVAGESIAKEITGREFQDGTYADAYIKVIENGYQQALDQGLKDFKFTPDNSSEELSFVEYATTECKAIFSERDTPRVIFPGVPPRKLKHKNQMLDYFLKHYSGTKISTITMFDDESDHLYACEEYIKLYNEATKSCIKFSKFHIRYINETIPRFDNTDDGLPLEMKLRLMAPHLMASATNSSAHANSSRPTSTNDDVTKSNSSNRPQQAMDSWPYEISSFHGCPMMIPSFLACDNPLYVQALQNYNNQQPKRQEKVKPRSCCSMQ